MTKENVKTGFFKKIYLAIKDFEHYGIFAAENLWTAIKYLLKIMVIFAIIVSGMFAYQFYTYFQNAIHYFENNIEQVSFVENQLEVNNGETIEIQEDTSAIPYIVIDTDATEEELQNYRQKLESYEAGIMVLKDKVLYKNEILAQSLEYRYEEITKNYPIGEFDKQAVLDFIGKIDMVSLMLSMLFVIFIYVYVVYLATAFVDIVMLGVLGFVVGRIAGMKIRFKATFNIGVYALTLPILLNILYIVVNTLTGFTIQNFSWMYTTISYIYVIVAIFMIKSDFIDKQAELMKIIEEQEKVRREMILKEEQQKKEEEKENKDNQDKKEPPKEEEKPKKKEKEEPGLDDGLAPQGAKELPNNE